jgi:hypothetical protein
MPIFERVEAKPQHCGMLVRRMRYEHLLALRRVGKDPHHELRMTFDASTHRRAWLLGGQIAGLGGVMAPIAAARGYVWMVISEQAARHPVAVIREARRHIDEIMLVKRELATTIIGGDEGAKRLSVFLGFHVEHDGDGSPAISRAGRRTLSEHLDGTPELRIPIGSGYAIGLGYHHDEEQFA